MDIVNEKTTPVLNVAFYDENGTAVVPTSATYQIDDVTEGRVNQSITGETSISVLAASVDIAITDQETKIIDAMLSSEKRLVTVKFQYGTNKRGSKEFRYIVKNLSKIT